MASVSSAAVPSWFVQARDSVSKANTFKELRERENARTNHRNAPPPSPTASPLRKSATSQSDAPDLTKYYSVAIGRDPVNKWANRYSNIEPYDRTRVVVGESKTACLGCGEEKGRYFNASWVKELHGQKWWIATQAPLRGTTHAFITALSQPIGPSSRASLPQGCRVRTVVQLTLLYESGRIKAYPYFSDVVGESMTSIPEPGVDAPPFVVTLREKRKIEKANCVLSKLSVVPQGGSPAQSFTFTHLLYTAWPDHGIPEEEDQASLLRFLRLADRVNKESHSGAGGSDSDPPIMVNCSAGVGRTGTFIALSSLLRFYNLLDPNSSIPSIPSGPSPTSPSLLGSLSLDPVAQEIDALREQRPQMVQRDEQIALVYQILEQAFLSK